MDLNIEVTVSFMLVILSVCIWIIYNLDHVVDTTATFGT